MSCPRATARPRRRRRPIPTLRCQPNRAMVVPIVTDATDAMGNMKEFCVPGTIRLRHTGIHPALQSSSSSRLKCHVAIARLACIRKRRAFCIMSLCFVLVLNTTWSEGFCSLVEGSPECTIGTNGFIRTPVSVSVLVCRTACVSRATDAPTTSMEGARRMREAGVDIAARACVVVVAKQRFYRAVIKRCAHPVRPHFVDAKQKCKTVAFHMCLRVTLRRSRARKSISCMYFFLAVKMGEITVSVTFGPFQSFNSSPKTLSRGSSPAAVDAEVEARAAGPASHRRPHST